MTARRINWAMVVVTTLLPVRLWAGLTAEQVLERHAEAVGGAASHAAIKTMVVAGTIDIPAQQVSGTFTKYTGRPNRFRLETTMQGMTFVQAFDGTTAWGINPMMGGKPDKAPPEANAVMAQQADIDGDLLRYRDRGITIALDGTVDIDGTTAYRITTTGKDSSTATYYIDAVTFLETRKEESVTQGGQTFTVAELKSDYRSVAGRQIPFSIVQLVDGNKQLVITATSVELDRALEDSLFVFPG